MSLRARQLSVRLGARQVLQGVDVQVERGELVAMIGANGAGKSTLLQALAGLVRVSSGQVEGGPVCLVPDEAKPCSELTVAEHLAFGATLAGASAERSRAVTQRLGLAPLLGARCGALSRGEARRVLLHDALVSNRPWLLLDEPLGTFDPLQLLEVIAALREKAMEGAGILVTCHQLSDAEKLADRIVMLHEGRVLAQGSLEALCAEAQLPGGSLEAVFLALLKRPRAAA